MDKLLYSVGEEDVGGYCTFINFPHISYLFIEIDKKSEKIYLINTKSIIPICETYKLTDNVYSNFIFLHTKGGISRHDTSPKIILELYNKWITKER